MSLGDYVGPNEGRCLSLTSELGWRLFEKRRLNRIFGPRREEVAGEWRRLHNEELPNLYDSPNVNEGVEVKESEVSGACSMHGGEVRGTQNVTCWET
jgi:hypothetical protein